MRVHAAAVAAGVEDALAAALLAERDSAVRSGSGVDLAKLVDRKLSLARQLGKFTVVDQHAPGRARAAVPALRALEAQSPRYQSVPIGTLRRLRSHEVTHL